MSYACVDQWDKTGKTTKHSKCNASGNIEELARAEKFGMRQQEQIDHTVKVESFLRSVLTSLIPTNRKTTCKGWRCIMSEYKNIIEHLEWLDEEKLLFGREYISGARILMSCVR